MKKRFKKLANWTKTKLHKIKPGKNSVKGAAFALLSFAIILWIAYFISTSIGTNDKWILVFALVMLIVLVLVAFVTSWLIKLIHGVPKVYKLVLLIVVPMLIIMTSNPIISIVIIILVSLVGASVMVIKKTGFKPLTKVKKVIIVFGLLIGISGLITALFLYNSEGYDLDPIINAAIQSETKIQSIQLESPAKKGAFKVKEFTYGSGFDLRRTEYGADVTIKTDSVNGVAFIDDWEGFSGWAREKYWGFDSKALPINGRVWYPEGEGTFPLVLVVHGNHTMQDYSDPGYDYLGELLASRGIILASVDENFINGTWTDIIGGLDEENDARAWLLLEHLKVWHQWNADSNNQFFKKIDTSNIALIGHSRGGEAVAHAAMFNRLPYYPDDASIALDYNYNIKSVIAIAPVDGQYKPASSKTEFEDVNYFVIHGSQDGDVSSFMGSEQYERITFKDSLYHVKSGLYVYGANHGQFNSTWGNNDVSTPFTGFLNLKQLLSKEEQQQIAEVYISAFLEATLKNKTEYLPLFIDARKGRDWLPETIYLNQFEDSNSKIICDFDEDFDVVTTTKKGHISSKNLTVWREDQIKLKWNNKGSRALFIGWDYEENEKGKDHESEDIPKAKIAQYSIEMGPNSVAIDSSAALMFSMAESTESSNPKIKGKWVDNEDEDEEEEKKKDEDEDEDKDEAEDKAKEPIDFTIVLEDTGGQKVEFLLSDFSGLQREIETVIWKIDFLTGDKESETVFQTFYFPFENIQKLNVNFDLSSIKKITYRFDKSKKGVVVIDNIGFMKTL
jgi:dienelactone hydrolase